MERAIQLIAALNFLLMGLSHITAHKEWAEFFILLRSKGAAGNFFNALLTLAMGSLIVGFHNVWTGLPMLLTILGWLYILKSALYLLFPRIGLRSLERISLEKSRKFIAAGVMLLVFSGVLFAHLWMTS